MERSNLRWGLSILACALACAGEAQAKVVFTGYSSFNFTPASDFIVNGPSSILTPAGITNGGHIKSEGFALDSLGLFATTQVNDNATFSADFTYRNIGNTVGQTRIQYAYLEEKLPWDVTLDAGKIELPFGYYNTHRFYPFQREELDAPLFLNSILGLPIASPGAELARRFDVGAFGIDVKVYGVNGYGSAPGSSETFRTGAIPNSNLAITNNLGASNNNTNTAFGGQLALNNTPNGAEVGVSYYEGRWDRIDKNALQMSAAHIHLMPLGFDLLAEGHHLYVQGDQGFVSTVNGLNWITDGGFVSASRPLFDVAGRPLTVFGRWEYFRSQRTGTPDGKEQVRGAIGGFSWKQSDNVFWKAEYYWLDYRLPSTTDTTLELNGFLTRIGLVLTF